MNSSLLIKVISILVFEESKPDYFYKVKICFLDVEWKTTAGLIVG